MQSIVPSPALLPTGAGADPSIGASGRPRHPTWRPGSFARLGGATLCLCLAIVAGCGGGETRKSSSGVTVVNGFETGCPMRAANVRREVRFGARRSCSAGCLQGSFCNAQTGFCDISCDPTDPAWTCENPNDYCACDGRCLPLAGAVDGATPSAASCPRDPVLLQSDAAANRVCQWDDECPYGSRCDQATSLCKFDCVATCDGGATCNCLGQCVAPDATAPPPPANAPRLAVLPQLQFLIPKSSDPSHPWGNVTTRELEVFLTAPFLTNTDDGPLGPSPPVKVQPDANLQVSCTQEPSPPVYQPAGQPCVLDEWNYVGSDAGAEPIRAKNRVLVKVVNPAVGTDPPTTWSVNLWGEGVIGVPSTVHFQSTAAPVVSAASDEPVDTTLATAKGTTFRGIFNIGIPDGKAIPVEVEARIQVDPQIPNGPIKALFVHDPSLLLSPAGVLVFKDIDFSAAGNTFVEVNRTGNIISINESAQLLTLRQGAAATDINPLALLAEGRLNLRSAVDNVADRSVPFSFVLQPTTAETPLSACVADGCGRGQFCSVRSGFCQEGETDEDFGQHFSPSIFISPTNFNQWFSTPHIPPTVAAASVWCADGVGQFESNLDNFATARPGWRTATSGDIPCLQRFSAPLHHTDVLTGYGPFQYAVRPDLDDLEESQTHVQPTPLTTSKLFDVCLAELKRLPSSDAISRGAGDSDDFDDYKSILDFPAKCVNVATMAKLMPLPARLTSSGLPDAPTRKRNAEALLVRSGQQWLKLHAFVVRQGLEQHALDHTLAGSADAVATTTMTGTATAEAPSAVALAELMENGLSVLLSQSFLPAAFNQAALPDYRESLPLPSCTNDDKVCRSDSLICDPGPGSCVVAGKLPKSDDQQNGLAPALLDALTAYLMAIEADLDDTAKRNYAADAKALPPATRLSLARAGTALRLVAFAQEDARKIHLKSCQVDGDSNQTFACHNRSLGAAWDSAIIELAAAIQRVAIAMGKLASGENPLGIAENDTPIFFGDVQGTNSRYFASSDYLLGGWAEPAIKSAQGALQSARDEWRAQRDREVSAEQRTDDLAIKYGTEILNTCGTPLMVDGSPLTASEVIESFEKKNIDPQLCFLTVRKDCPASLDVKTLREFTTRKVTKDALKADFCRLDYLNRLKGHPLKLTYRDPLSCFFQPFRGSLCASGFNCTKDCGACNNDETCEKTCDGSWTTAYCDAKFCHDRTTTFACTRKSETCNGMFQLDKCTADESKRGAAKGNACLQYDAAEGWALRFDRSRESDVWKGLIYGGDKITAVNQSQNAPSAPDVTCEATVADLRRPSIEQYRGTPAWEDADAFCSQEGFTDLSEFDIETKCLQGTLGDSVKAIQIAKDDAQAAMSELETEAGILEKKIIFCKTQLMDDMEVFDALDEYLNTRHDWLEISMVVRAIGQGAATYFNPALAQATVATTAIETGSAAGPELFGALAQHFIDEAEGRYQRVALANSQKERKLACELDIQSVEGQMAAARLRIKRQADVVDAEKLKFRNLQRSNQLAFETGHAAIEREKTRTGPSFAYHFWYQEKVDRFQREMEWARRLTYLAMRSVEFELQQTLDLRAKILTAAHPDELESVTTALNQERGSRTINRRRPEESSVVLSLRDDVLQVQDHSTLTSGERNWGSAMRFKGRLWDQRYAVYDRSGNWLGQGVPFHLQESGVLDNRCGERLWRVTATVQGDGLSELEPGTSLQLLKRNTFMSQWCSGKGEGQGHYQIDSIRTSSELLKGIAGRSEDVNGYTAAILYPWFNVRRFDFYDVQYRKGASEELAGRGLYGDYIILFPKEVLNKSASNPDKKPFPLANVEDVLLRIDYLSVDDLPAVQATRKGATTTGRPGARDHLAVDSQVKH
jgi:hypothetical protein